MKRDAQTAILGACARFLRRGLEPFTRRLEDFESKSLTPMAGRIAQLEKELAARPDLKSMVDAAVASLPAPQNGKDADMDALRAFIAEQVRAIPAPKDGKSVTLEDVAPLIREEVRAEAATHLQGIPHPKDGKSVALEDVRPMLDDAIKQLRADADEAIAEPLRLATAARDSLLKAVGELRQPADGKSVTLEDVQPVLDEALGRMQKEVSAAVERTLSEARAAAEFVQRAVANIPIPKDGTSVTLAEVQPVLNGAIEAMRTDAAAAVDAAIKAIPVVKDGEPGKSITAEDVAPVLELNVAKWALEFERRGNDIVQRVLDKIVQPKDGEPGRDGLGFDDLAVEYDGEKTITLKMQRGDVVKEANIVLPINIDRGIFKEGQAYTAGDSVTWGGSYWIAQRDTGAKPDSADSGWRLAVKKGRDGKDGRNGIDKTAPVALKD